MKMPEEDWQKNQRKCKGILGMIFGHKFKSFIEASSFNHAINNCETTRNLIELCDKISTKKYKIICKRCGKETYEVNP
jgi:thymidine kinase